MQWQIYISGLQTDIPESEESRCVRTGLLLKVMCSTACFDDPKQTDKERHLQEAVLNVKQRYGKNAIMRGSNLLECSTYRERNEQVGGHRV